jgi:hypothetical protein
MLGNKATGQKPKLSEIKNARKQIKGLLADEINLSSRIYCT